VQGEGGKFSCGTIMIALNSNTVFSDYGK